MVNLFNLCQPFKGFVFMPIFSATAVAHPNIAFIKYWGNRDSRLRIPLNNSISMNLAGLQTTTCVSFRAEMEMDVLNLNRTPIYGKALERVSNVLDVVRKMSGLPFSAEVVSTNNFPTGAGIASSASAFAALALAGSCAAGMSLSEPELSRLARLGSGSAARSIPGGFVEWQAGEGDADSIAFSIAPAGHWPLVDLVAIVQSGPKAVGSSEGHALAGASPLQSARVQDASRRLAACRKAIQTLDFEALAWVVEQDSNMMHAVMMTSNPPLFYWEPASVAVMKRVPQWRMEGLAACYTMDAGPNVHVICAAEHAGEVFKRLERIPGVSQVLSATPGGPAQIISAP
jgi:diphosphomevalonate decarboxylase